MVGRNDPCPCGSGKKYKKCCEREQVPDTGELVTKEADRVLESYFESVFQSPGVIQDYEKRKWDWLTVLNGVDTPGNWEDMFEEVYLFLERADLWKRHLVKAFNGPVRSGLRDILERWMEPVFVLAKITAVNDETVTVEQVLEHEVYEFAKRPDMHLLVGGVVSGIALPEAQLSRRGIDFISGFDFIRNDNGGLVQEIEQLADVSGLADSRQFYARHGAELYKLLMTWAHAPITANLTQAQQEALQFLLNEIKKHDGDALACSFAEGLFTGYYLAKKPNVRKHEGVAAAVFLVLSELMLIPDAYFTQSEIAKKFGISVASMTRHLDPLEAILSEVEEASRRESPSFSYYVGTLPRMTERPNWEMSCLAGRSSFDTFEQTELYLQRQMNQPFTPETPEEEAQAICYEAYEVAADYDRARKMAENALKLDSQSIDAELLLAHSEASAAKVEGYLRKAVRKGEKTFDGFSDNPWRLVTNRPYLRALLTYGVFLYEEERYAEASTYFRMLLDLNPDDNQGVRYLAVAAYLKIGQLDKAKRMLDKHGLVNEQDAVGAFLLWHYESLRAGWKNTPLVEHLFENAQTLNRYMEAIMEEGLPDLPYPRGVDIEAGSMEEALYIWSLL